MDYTNYTAEVYAILNRNMINPYDKSLILNSVQQCKSIANIDAVLGRNVFLVPGDQKRLKELLCEIEIPLSMLYMLLQKIQDKKKMKYKKSSTSVSKPSSGTPTSSRAPVATGTPTSTRTPLTSGPTAPIGTGTVGTSVPSAIPGSIGIPVPTGTVGTSASTRSPLTTGTPAPIGIPTSGTKAPTIPSPKFATKPLLDAELDRIDPTGNLKSPIYTNVSTIETIISNNLPQSDLHAVLDSITDSNVKNNIYNALYVTDAKLASDFYNKIDTAHRIALGI